MKQRILYDRTEVGERMKSRRRQLGWNRKFVADEVGLAEKYYADIERGTCGMSIETLISVSKLLGFTMDEMIYGEAGTDDRNVKNEVLIKNLDSLSAEEQDYCIQMLFLFMHGLRNGKGAQESDAPMEQGRVR